MLIAIYDLLLLEILAVVRGFWSFLPFCKFMIFRNLSIQLSLTISLF